MQFLKKYFGLIFVLAISFFAIQPLFIPGFFPMHDDTQVARVFEMGKSLKDGMFPVRWVSSLGYGYGYPIFNFYAPFSYYVGGILVVLEVDPLLSTKIMIALGMLFAGVGMYLLSKSIWGEFGGIIAAVLYMYAPYHALNLYVRGAIGELWAYGLLPFMAWGFFELSIKNAQLTKKEKWKWLAVASLGYAGVILSHNLTAMMVTPFLATSLLLYCFIAYKKNQLNTTVYFLYAIILGLLISAFYWVPAIFEMGYTNVRSQVGGGADFRDHFVCVSQLWNSQWMFGGSTKGCLDGLSFQIGKLHLILAFVAIVIIISLFFIKKIRNHYDDIYHYSGVYTFLVFGFCTSLFLMIEPSRIIWESIPQMAFLQYPWRFLALLSFFTSLLAGSIIFSLLHIFPVKFDRKIVLFGVFVASIGIVVFYQPIFTPQTISPKISDSYTNEFNLKWTTSKISDEYMPIGFAKPKDSSGVAHGDIFQIKKGLAIIKGLEKKTQLKSAEIMAEIPTEILAKVAYFPAWNLYINGKKENYEITNNGLSFLVSPGTNTVELRFEQTTVEKIANALSLGGLLLLLIGIIYTRRKNYRA